MVSWLIVIILAYLFFGLSSLGDKLVLSGKPEPKSYTFYVGVLSLFVIVLIPFVKFGFPDNVSLFWIIIDSLAHIIGVYTMFVAIEKFDVSKVVTTLGATQPIFIFLLTWIFFGPQIMPVLDIIAFIILFLASLIISIDKNIEITGYYLKITTFSSLMFSLDYIFSKFVFLGQPFWQGIIWMRLCVFLLVLVFLFSKKSRKQIFAKRMIIDKKTQTFFVWAQASGAAANLLQSFAIFLAPIAFLATVNSLRGIQYVFIFLATIFLSYFFPKILKESISKRVIFQKIASIILIVAGLVILAN